MRALLLALAAAALFAAGWYAGRLAPRAEDELVDALQAEWERGVEAQRRARPDLERLEARLATQAADMRRLREQRQRAVSESLALLDRARRSAQDHEGADLQPPLDRIRALAPGRYGSMTVAELRHLRELDLSGTAASDDDLAMLAALPALRRLTLRKSRITDEGLRHVAKMKTIEHLGLRETSITDDGLAHLAGLDTLEGLDVNLTPITDSGLRHLAGMTSLTFLRLNYTKVTDAGLVHLRNLVNLERLDLWATATGTHPDRLREMTWLKHLELGATAVSREWVEDFKAANPGIQVRSRWDR